MATTARSRVSEGIDGKDAVGLYLEGIAKTPLLTAEEEVELAQSKGVALELGTKKRFQGGVRENVQCARGTAFIERVGQKVRAAGTLRGRATGPPGGERR